MIVRTKFNTELNEIAKSLGIRSDFTYVGHARDGQNRYSGKLYPESDKFRRLGFHETTRGNRLRVNAVCAHGHYAFMKKLFDIDPEASVESSFTRQFHDKVTRVNLEAMHRENLYRNIGSMMEPAFYGELCVCSGLYPFSEKPRREKKTLEQTVKSISEDRERFGLEAL